jgi:hypothetical protein
LKPKIQYSGFNCLRKRLDQVGISDAMHLQSPYIYKAGKHKAALLAMLGRLGNVARIALA